MRIEIGYKFTIGFVCVIASVVFVPYITGLINLPKGLEDIVSTLVAIVIGLSIGVYFSRTFAKKFQELSSAAEAISEGNLKPRNILTTRMTFEDETIDLENSIKKMVNNLRELVTHVKENSQSVSDSAQSLSATAEEMNASTEEISSTIEQIAKGAELQTEMVEKTSRLIKNIADSIEKVAINAREAAENATETSHTAQNGSGKMAGVLEKLKEVFGRIESSSEVVFKFGNKTQEVGKIVEVITRIAQQTNLLALNATVEAARAGEYGRGFAVVAEEIRKLAESSSQSAEQITALIKEIEEESGKAVGSLRESTGLMSEGKKSIETTGQILTEIVKKVLVSKESSDNIYKLTRQQLDGAHEMVEAIDEIAKVAEDNAASTEQASAATGEQTASMQEMASAAQELSDLAEEMRKVTERFEV